MKRILILASFFLASCGGGGGYVATPTPPLPPQKLQSVNFPQQQAPLSLFGTVYGNDSSGNQWSLEEQDNGISAGTWNGNVVSVDTQIQTWAENIQGVLGETDEIFFTTDPFNPLGEAIQLNAGGNIVYETFVYTSYQGFPTTLTVGGSGTVAAGNYYTGIPGTTLIGNATTTYSVAEYDTQAIQVTETTSGVISGNSVSVIVVMLISATDEIQIASIATTAPNGEAVTLTGKTTL